MPVASEALLGIPSPKENFFQKVGELISTAYRNSKEYEKQKQKKQQKHPEMLKYVK